MIEFLFGVFVGALAGMGAGLVWGFVGQSVFRRMLKSKIANTQAHAAKTWRDARFRIGQILTQDRIIRPRTETARIST
jgi:hypothetical protein